MELTKLYYWILCIVDSSLKRFLLPLLHTLDAKYLTLIIGHQSVSITLSVPLFSFYACKMPTYNLIMNCQEDR